MNSKDSFNDWEIPKKTEGQLITGLQVSNSLKNGEKVEFVPEKGNQVKIYNCGPTVYAPSHMGHARTYISADIIIRILRNYLGYDVHFVENITDIDDKIITGANLKEEDFTSFARHWEKQYWEDMSQLNVLPPDTITRVSEHIPEIIAMIKKIIANGFGYEAEDGVYFDVKMFDSKENHFYAKMEPFSQNNTQLLEQGEGSLSKGSGKRNKEDFALWKSSKPNEPKWNSPWGEGRPGWHIECSAMVYSNFGDKLDIHMGGIDLRFPHHDNEIAQSEACINHDHKNQWVNYFIHFGHLNIDGQKMSKSLKNFLSIEDVLQEYTARQIRLCICQHKLNSPMNFHENTMLSVIEVDQQFEEFFLSLEAAIRGFPLHKYEQQWEIKENELNATLMEAQMKIHQAILDNFNIPDCILLLENLICKTNSYIRLPFPQAPLLSKIGQFVSGLTDLLGFTYEFQVNRVQKQKEDIIEYIVSMRSAVKQNAPSQNFQEIIETVKRTNFNILFTDEDFQNERDMTKKFTEDILAHSEQQDTDSLFKVIDDARSFLETELMVKLEDRSQNEPTIWKTVS